MFKSAYIPVFILKIVSVLLLVVISTSLFAQIDKKRTFPTPDSLMRKVGEENVDTTYAFQWNEDSSRWEIHERDLLFYNQKHKLFTIISQNWKDAEWKNIEREIKEYNDDGDIHQRLHQSWNEAAGTWVNLELKTYLYNAQGEKSEILYQQWRKALGEWISTVRYLFEYNRDGENISILIRMYSSAEDKWLNYQRYLFRYFSSYGPPNIAVVERWNRAKKDWIRAGKYSMKYNFRGKKIMEQRATWSTTNEMWINGVRFLFNYDKKLRTEKVEQKWDFQAEEWHNSVRYTYTYDEEGELEVENKYTWDPKQQKWILVRKLRYSAVRLNSLPSK
jgi:hypothetical protein